MGANSLLSFCETHKPYNLWILNVNFHAKLMFGHWRDDYQIGGLSKSHGSISAASVYRLFHF